MRLGSHLLISKEAMSKKMKWASGARQKLSANPINHAAMGIPVVAAMIRPKRKTSRRILVAWISGSAINFTSPTLSFPNAPSAKPDAGATTQQTEPTPS
jgi:hypothetical protein